MKSYYVMAIYDGIDPSLSGPFETEHDRDAEAADIRRRTNPDTTAIAWIDQGEGGELETGPYQSEYLEGCAKGGAA